MSHTCVRCGLTPKTYAGDVPKAPWICYDCVHEHCVLRELHDAEVFLLKKELGEQSLQWAEHCNKAYLKGERQAMERVREAIQRAKSHVADTSEGRAYYLAIKDIETDSGLGEGSDNNNYTNKQG